jgi:drug/metabolite transporter (DMT)-like permease
MSIVAASPIWSRLSPALFVFLWATGFVGATWGLPYGEPFTFLAVRIAIVVVLLVAIAGVSRAPWPAGPKQCFHNAVVGVFIHAIYLGGVFYAISRGMPTGLSALVVGLQPALTALAARPMLGERVTAAQWLGIGLGFAGLVLVFWDKANVGGEAGWPLDWVAVAASVTAVVGMTAGSLYQKAFVSHQDVRTGTVWQYGGALVPMLALALLLEDGRIEWTGDFIFAMTWLVLVLSIGAVSLLMIIIRHGEVSKVAGLFYMVPVVTAIMAYFIFDERLNALQIAGVAVTTLGVALVSRRR